MADWATEATNFSGGGVAASTAGAGQNMSETEDRSSKVQARLKAIYRKTVLPVEKRFRYDYFYESPFLSDVEFDCEYKASSER